jgi:hypothetical protein
LINLKVDMVGFVNLHKVVARKITFWIFPSAWNGVESKNGVGSKRLKHQFSQVEGVLDLQKILKLIPIRNKRIPLKKNNCDERQKWERCKSWKENPLCIVRIKNIKKSWKKKKEKDPKLT